MRIRTLPVALVALLVSTPVVVARADEPIPPPGAPPAGPGTSPPGAPGTTITPPPVEKRAAVELTTLKLLHAKGLISDAEYEGALRDLGETLGAKAGDALTLALSKWSVTIYGFADTDLIYDTTQSLNESPGNSLIARPDTYAGSHDRFTFSIRNSRLGFRIRAPEFHHIRASAVLEADFLGNQPPNASEQATFTNPTFRARNYMLKLETPVVDVIIGQSWNLFGFQPYYFPCTLEIQGVPGQLYNRTPQLRLTKVIKTAPVNVEVMLGITRGAQRESGMPDAQGGVRLVLNQWTGMQTVNSTGTSIAPASVGVSGVVRQLSLNEFSSPSKTSVGKLAWGVAVGAFLPLLPARPEKKGNALSLTGEYVLGEGVADIYSGLTGGVTSAALPNPDKVSPAPSYTPNIDPGLAVFTADGVLHAVRWQTYNVGLQYYFPGLDGHLWIAANYAHTDLDNPGRQYGAKVRSSEDWFDASLFADVTPAVRLAVDYGQFRDHYTDGVDAVNHRVQAAAFFLF